MKILIATFTYAPEKNGVANVCSLQVEVLKKLKHDVHVISSCLVGSKDLSIDNISNVYRFNISGTGELGTILGGNIADFRGHIVNQKYDVIFVHCWQAWPINVLMRCEYMGSKLILFSHGTSVNTVFDFKSAIHKLLWLPYRYFFMPKVFNKLSAFVHLSAKKDNDRFLDNRICPDHVFHEVISNCVNHIEYKYKALGDDSLFSLLVVGGYSRLKNEMFVLKRIIDMNFPCKINFVGYKENTYSKKMHEIYNKYLKKCHDHSSVPQVVVVFNYGMREDDILSLYSSSDLFISASKTECQPLVILQAMAYGVPFLSSAVGCVDELPGGLIYRNQNQFDHILSRLYDDYRSGKSELLKLSYEGYHFAFSELSVEKYQEKIRTLLTRVEA